MRHSRLPCSNPPNTRTAGRMEDGRVCGYIGTPILLSPFLSCVLLFWVPGYLVFCSVRPGVGFYSVGLPTPLLTTFWEKAGGGEMLAQEPSPLRPLIVADRASNGGQELAAPDHVGPGGPISVGAVALGRPGRLSSVTMPESEGPVTTDRCSASPSSV